MNDYSIGKLGPRCMKMTTLTSFKLPEKRLICAGTRLCKISVCSTGELDLEQDVLDSEINQLIRTVIPITSQHTQLKLQTKHLLAEYKSSKWALHDKLLFEKSEHSLEAEPMVINLTLHSKTRPSTVTGATAGKHVVKLKSDTTMSVPPLTMVTRKRTRVGGTEVVRSSVASSSSNTRMTLSPQWGHKETNFLSNHAKARQCSPRHLEPRRHSPRHLELRRHSPSHLVPRRRSPRHLEPRRHSPIHLEPRQHSPSHLEPRRQSPSNLEPKQHSPRYLEPGQGTSHTVENKRSSPHVKRFKLSSCNIMSSNNIATEHKSVTSSSHFINEHPPSSVHHSGQRPLEVSCHKMDKTLIAMEDMEEEMKLRQLLQPPRSYTSFVGAAVDLIMTPVKKIFNF